MAKEYGIVIITVYDTVHISQSSPVCVVTTCPIKLHKIVVYTNQLNQTSCYLPLLFNPHPVHLMVTVHQRVSVSFSSETQWKVLFSNKDVPLGYGA